MLRDEQRSPVGESSVPVPNRMLRRLKKAQSISDLCPGSETLDEDLRKPVHGFEGEDGMRSDLQGLGAEDRVNARKVLDFDSVPDINPGLENLGEKGVEEISDLETRDEIRVLESKEAGNDRLVSEMSVPQFDSRVLGEKGEDEVSDSGIREENRVAETKEAEKEQSEPDLAIEDLDEISDLGTRDETRVLETEEAGKEQPVSEASVPEFDSVLEESDEGSDDELFDLETEETGKKRRVLEMNDSEEEESKVKKKKRSKKSVDFDELPVSTASMNMTKKERREYLDQLRAENQRILRETRDAAFEPVPLVRKPISSVLEKIRKRKEEISKQFLSRKKSISVEKCERDFKEDASDDDVEEILVVEKNDDMDMKFISKQNPEEQDCLEDSAGPSGNSDEPSNKKAESSPTPQDPSLHSQTTNSGDEFIEKTSCRPLEEVMTPSVVTMNLKRNPSPAADNSEEGAEHIKENYDHETHDSSPGDPVRKFIDDAAEEEDDSDNDLLRFEDEDEDDDEEDDDLRDMIASQFKEDPADKDRRDELHQKWLEQQDAAGTEKLLKKLKRGMQQDATSLSEDEDDHVDDEARAEDADDEEVTKPGATDDEEDPINANSMRINMKKIKETIPLMFTDEDDVYVSSDDEEWEKKLQQQRLYKKMEQKTKSSLPAGDKNSEEILRHIKKPEIRKKAKPTSFKEKALMGINKNPAASKSSFLGRLTKSSVSEGSRKRGSNIVRGYIFERDDSNVRSSNSAPEEPSAPEMIVQEKSRPKRAPAKFTASQSQEMRSATSQATTGEEEKSTRQRSTLFEILKMSSKKTCFTSGETVISSSHTESIFAAFKLDKKPVKK